MIFRPEALDAVKYKNFGEIFIKVPRPLASFIIILTGLIISLSLILLFTDVTEHQLVLGFLNSTPGLVHIFPKNPGVLVKSYVQQGDVVHVGEPLFLIDTSYDGLDVTHKYQLELQWNKRKQTLTQQIHDKQARLIKLQPLLQKKFISQADFLAKQDEITELQQRKNDITMQWLMYQQSRSYTIKAPVPGIISSLLTQAGQPIIGSKPLANILPQNTQFIAQLYVPVAQAGFLAKLDKLLLHYDAYPFQHFGAANAAVINISQNALTDADETKPLHIGQPYYKVIAQLNKQTIAIDGKEQALKHGMTFTAILTGQRKPLWQWIIAMM